MTRERVPLIVELPVGYVDREGECHDQATLGRALKARDFFAIKDDWQLGGEFLYKALTLQRTITAFGSLPIPVRMGDLLALDSLDFDHLALAYDEFANQCGQPERLNPTTLKLVFGVSVKGVGFDVVELGANLTAAHLNEACRRKLEGVPLLAYLLSREVLKLRDSTSGQMTSGPLAFDELLEMDSLDLLALLEISDFCQSSMAHIAQSMSVSVAEAIERLSKPGADLNAVFARLAGRSNN